MNWIAQYWIEALFGVVLSGITLVLRLIYKRVKTQLTESELTKDGTLALLHDRLYHACNVYITQGEITTDDLKNLEYMYESYHALGGNGTCTALYTKCQNLKIKGDV